MAAASETSVRNIVEQARRKQEFQKRVKHATEYIQLFQFRLKQFFDKIEAVAKTPDMMPRYIVKQGFSLDEPGSRTKAILAAWKELYAALKQLELASVTNVPEPESVEELISLVRSKYAAFQHAVERNLQEFGMLAGEYHSLINSGTFWNYFSMLADSLDEDFRALGTLINEICMLAQGGEHL